MFHADFFGKRTMQLAALIAAWPMKILSREYVFAAWTVAAVFFLFWRRGTHNKTAGQKQRPGPTKGSQIP